MIKQLSPGIVVNEIDQSQVISDITEGTNAVVVGDFAWGPVGEPVYINSIKGLTDTFREPTTDDQNRSFFAGYNYLSYGSGGLWVSRAAGENANNAVAINITPKDLNVNDLANSVLVFANGSYSADATTIQIYNGSVNAPYANNLTNVTTGMYVFANINATNVLMKSDYAGDTKYWIHENKTNITLETTIPSYKSTSTTYGMSNATSSTGSVSRYVKHEMGKDEFSVDQYVKDGSGNIISAPIDASQNVTFSGYFYANTSDTNAVSNVAMRLAGTSGTSPKTYTAAFDLANTTPNIYKSNSGIVCTANKVGSTKWYRCSITANLYDTPIDIKDSSKFKVSVIAVDQTPTTISPSTNFGFSGNKKLYFADLQLEQSSKPTSYRKGSYSLDFLGKIVDKNTTANTIEIDTPIPADVLSDGDKLIIANRKYTSVKLNSPNYIDDTTTYHNYFVAKYPGILGNSLKIAICSNKDKFSTFIDPDTQYEYKKLFNKAPGTSNSIYVEMRSKGVDVDTINKINDELHIVVVDQEGRISGKKGAILEKLTLSKATNAINEYGENIYYKNYINKNSKYILALDLLSKNWNIEYDEFSFISLDNKYYTFDFGVNHLPTLTDIEANIDIFKDFKKYPLDIVISAGSMILNETQNKDIINYFNDNIIELRKDCVMTISPPLGTILNKTQTDATNDILEYYQNLALDSTRIIADDNWKYQYNPFTKKYIWIPLNADIAGVMSRTDKQYEPWWSPSGYTRGKILNVVKLAWSANQESRDVLYPNGINSVITEAGEGTLLFGDKTFTDRNTTFGKINVRRLFLTVQKVIKKMARSRLFEFNDTYTRETFRSTVNSYLQSVKNRRGIENFKVICDETNNPEDIVNASGFVADIWIQPAMSINYIQLNFINTSSGLEFNIVE